MGNVLDCAVESEAGEGKDGELVEGGGGSNSSGGKWNSSIPLSGGGGGDDGGGARDILEPVSAEAIQAHCRLGDSGCVLWSLQRDFYKEVGEQAWSRGIVPNYVSSNAFIAKCYARVVVEFANEWYSGALGGDPDRNEPIFLLELGSGSGKFAFLLINQLLRLGEFFPDVGPRLEGFPFRVILSDVAEKNVAFWRQHRALRPFFERGIVDTAILDAENVGGAVRLASGASIDPSTLKSPIMSVSNYVFNSLSHDAFQVRARAAGQGNDDDGGGAVLHFAKCTTSSTAKSLVGMDGEEIVPQPFELIQGMSTSWTYEAARPGDDFYGDPAFNFVPRKYAQLISGDARVCAPETDDPAAAEDFNTKAHLEHGGDSSVLIPLGGMKLLRDLAAICKGANVPFLALVGDKGYQNHRDMAGLRNPHIAKHGSFSLMVNFHALRLYAQEAGGFSLLSSYAEGFKCSLMGFNFDKAQAPMTCRAFHDWANGFDPESFSTLQRCDHDECNAPSLRHALSLIRLSSNDPDVFYKFKHVVIGKVGSVDTSEHTRKDLRRTIKGVLENNFHLQNSKDICFEMARVYMGLKDYRTSIRLFDSSTENCGAHNVTLHNQGICYYYLEEYENAKERFLASLAKKPSYEAAQSWLRKTDEKLGTTTLQPIVVHDHEIEGGNVVVGGNAVPRGVMEV
jgi:hypothetical protein